MASSTVRSVSRTFSAVQMTIHPVAGLGDVGTKTHLPMLPLASICTLPVPNPRIQSPSDGYSASTTLLKLGCSLADTSVSMNCFTGAYTAPMMGSFERAAPPFATILLPKTFPAIIPVSQTSRSVSPMPRPGISVCRRNRPFTSG